MYNPLMILTINGGSSSIKFARDDIGEPLRRSFHDAAELRARICSILGFLGIELDEARNAANAPVISTEASPATVRVIHTDEELMIARAVSRLV